MKQIAVISLLMMVVLLGTAGGEADAPTEDLNDLILRDLDELHTKWEQFKTHAGSTAEEALPAFRAFQRAFRTSEFALNIILQPATLRQLNNSVHWVRLDRTFARAYPEAGILQIMEKRLQQEMINDEAGRIPLLSRVDTLLLKARVSLAADRRENSEWLFAILLDQYRQYFLTLSAYDRLDTKDVVGDYRAALRQHLHYLRYLTGTAANDGDALPEALSLLQELYKRLSEQNFNELDRAAILKDFLQPAWSTLQKSALQLSKGYIPDWADQLTWSGVSPFSADWLDPTAFLPGMPPGVDREKLIALGELLFYEPMLSHNNKRTCASCHKPQKAFSDGRAVSRGFDFSADLDRNAPSLVNSVYNRYYKHDNSLGSIPEQILSVIDHPQEFRTSMKTILEKLRTSATYRSLFADCFSTDAIDSVQVLRALTAYNGSIVSFSSPMDQYFSGWETVLPEKAIAGYNLFMGKALCGSCHFAPLFSGLQPPFFEQQEYHSHGVFRGVKWPEMEDRDLGLEGRRPFSERKQDYRYFFKTPGLRNTGVTAPYMHNGLFNDIRETVLYLFDESRPHAANANFPPGASNLSNDEQEAIAVFLESLNDRAVLEAYSEDILLPPTDGTLAPKQRKAAGVY